MLSQVVRASRRAAPPRRPARAPRYHLLPRRTLSTSPSPGNEPDTDPSAEVYDALYSAPSTPSTSTSKVPRPVRPRAIQTAFIRTWKPLNNIADAYAMIRAIERKYGKILEAHFLRDYEVPTNYQSMSWVVFADPKSLQRIPEKGFDFTIPATGIKKEAHELGMEDLEHIAREGNYEEGFELVPIDPESKQEFIGGRIIRAEEDYCPEAVDRRLYQPTSKVVMRSWLQWGGFARLTPIDSSKVLKAEDLFDPRKKEEIDHIRMRASLQLAAMVTKTQNPAVIQVSRVKDRAKEEEPSFGSMVFSGLLEGKAEDATANKERSTSASEPPISATETAPSESTPSSPAPEVESSPSASTSPLPETSIPTTPPSPSQPQPLTPEQIAQKEALERQLEVARQLRERVSPTRRKQAKPVIPTRTSAKSRAAASSLSQQRQQPELEFFEGEKVEELAKEAEKPSGVLGRLWGFLRR